MYSIRPNITENVPLNLPETMYKVRPILSNKQDNVFQEISDQQDALLAKIDELFKRLELQQAENKLKRESFVVHLSTKTENKAILDLVERFRDQVSINSYRHSSLGNESSPMIRSTERAEGNRLTIVWAQRENLPSLFHSKTSLNDESTIVQYLNERLTLQD